MKINFKIQGTPYYIDADGSCYTLYAIGVNRDKDSKKFGEPTERFIGHYTKIVNGLNRAVQTELGNSIEEIDLKEFLLRYESAMESISNQIGDK